jgi:hypothetical protein
VGSSFSPPTPQPFNVYKRQMFRYDPIFPPAIG